ncbi:hypothetical protein ScalyP_jg6008 [Parmales sp. scaly parma]|nr:hypothetical protein ScalyP_jg6008 [Parmales sp. scaly parma]
MHEVAAQNVCQKLNSVNDLLTTWNFSHEYESTTSDLKQWMAHAGQHSSGMDPNHTAVLHKNFGKLLHLEVEAKEMKHKWVMELNIIRGELAQCGLLGVQPSTMDQYIAAAAACNNDNNNNAQPLQPEEDDKKAKTKISTKKQTHEHKGTAASAALEAANALAIESRLKQNKDNGVGFRPSGNEHRRRSITSNEMACMGDMFDA